MKEDDCKTIKKARNGFRHKNFPRGFEPLVSRIPDGFFLVTVYLNLLFFVLKIISNSGALAKKVF
jgi:hypothetical protein